MTDAAAVTVACPHCRALNRLPAARLGDRPGCGRCHQALFEGRPLAMDEAGFDAQVLRGGLPVLVDFWAPWCGPCVAMAPQFDKAAAQLEPHVRVGKVDTQALPALGGRFNVRSIPTLILFRDGREIARQSGAMSAGDIVRWTGAALAGEH